MKKSMFFTMLCKLSTGISALCKPLVCLTLLILSVLALAGCGKEKKTEIVLTTDFEEGEVFRIENMSCYEPEVMVYLVNSENLYDTIFGADIWQIPIDGTTLENKYKDTILARLAQIKVMNLMAADQDFKLNDDDVLRVKSAARDYYASLNPVEREVMKVDEDTLYNIYYEFATADKLYHDMTDKIEPEISDDEARIVTVRDILIKTYKPSAAGTVSYNRAERDEAYERILNIKNRLDEGADFDVIAESTENEDERIEYSFGRGVMPASYEEAAFSLVVGEISDIVETDYGYHILKCITAYDPEETDKNREIIIKKKKQEAFNKMYDDYLQNINSNLNADLWDTIAYAKSDAVTTTTFFDVYDTYFIPVTGASYGTKVQNR
ncbi:MAG TPA: peptidylprolyl isomerase [Lachnospiraceae bacterium]|nr:peptidylprolyl isomerase [Lachnospiraceae bacterium]